MKKYNKITLILLFAALGMQGVKAQDVGYSQFFANPLYLNPAFAGSKVAPRISLAYRAQWPGLVSAFSSVSASYDQYIPDLHGGIGAIVLSDRQGDHGMLNTNMLGAMYSFRFRLHEDIYINLALQASVRLLLPTAPASSIPMSLPVLWFMALRGMQVLLPTISASPARVSIAKTVCPSSSLPMPVV